MYCKTISLHTAFEIMSSCTVPVKNLTLYPICHNPVLEKLTWASFVEERIRNTYSVDVELDISLMNHIPEASVSTETQRAYRGIAQMYAYTLPCKVR